MTTSSTANGKNFRRMMETDGNIFILTVHTASIVYVPARILFEHNINGRTITRSEDKNAFKLCMCVCVCVCLLLRKMFRTRKVYTMIIISYRYISYNKRVFDSTIVRGVV